MKRLMTQRINGCFMDRNLKRRALSPREIPRAREPPEKEKWSQLSPFVLNDLILPLFSPQCPFVLCCNCALFVLWIKGQNLLRVLAQSVLLIAQTPTEWNSLKAAWRSTILVKKALFKEINVSKMIQSLNISSEFKLKVGTTLSKSTRFYFESGAIIREYIIDFSWTNLG